MSRGSTDPGLEIVRRLGEQIHYYVFDAIRALMEPPEKSRKKIGFEVKEKKTAYGKK